MRSLIFGIGLAVILIVTVSGNDGQSNPQLIPGLEKPLPSPDGRFELLWKRNEPAQMHEIWIRSTDNPKDETLLYSLGRSGDALWSPDSTMVAITDAATSDQAFVTIFRIAGSNAFEEIKEVIEDKYFKRKDGSYIFDHTYGSVAGWSKDSKSLQVELKAHGAMEGSNRSLQKKVIVRIPQGK